MAIPRVNTCCFKFDLETGGLLIAIVCVLGFISQINQQPFAYIFIAGMYVYTVRVHTDI